VLPFSGYNSEIFIAFKEEWVVDVGGVMVRGCSDYGGCFAYLCGLPLLV